MNAFFIYFLSQLSCKKINPSSQRSLSGLSLHKIELLNRLRKLNISVQPVHIRNSRYINHESESEFKPIRATLIGDVPIPQEQPAIIAEQLRLISKEFCLSYVSAIFVSDDGKNYFLADVSTIPDISESTHRNAILQYFS